MNRIINFLLFRRYRAGRAENAFIRCLQSELAEEFLQILLNLMSLVFYLNQDFRRNIKHFQAAYLFKSKDSTITMAAVFKNNKLKVYEKEIDHPHITVIFKDGKALVNYLLSPKPDILGSILNQEVTFEGNLNYLYKFAYMAKRLQLMATGSV